MDELLAEMNPMGDEDDDADLEEEMDEMEQDLDDEDREELEDDEEEEEEDNEGETQTASARSSGPAATEAGRLEQEKRTIFVTNVAVTTKKKKLMSLFKKFGAVESIRFRNVSFAKGGKCASF